MPNIDTTGFVPRKGNDDTRNWAEAFRVNNQIKPNVVLRIATDTNYIFNQSAPIGIYGGLEQYQTKAVMNLALPGMRIPHVMSWSVSESIESPVQTANFEIVNALAVSNMQSTLGSALPKRWHHPNIKNNYVQDSLGRVQKLPGNVPVEDQRDGDGIYYRENNVRYRTFEPETFTINSSSSWPDPSIPNDVDGNDVVNAYGSYISSTGVGGYFIQVDNEIMRVSARIGTTWYILPGGRAINEVLEDHAVGAPVKVLGYPAGRGEYAGLGYASVDDFKPYQNFLRPGTCLVSYEGYGKFPTLLDHNIDHSRNYVFTGYWFVKGIESSLGEDMLPKLRVDLVSAGELFNKQKITPDLVQRVRTQFGQWRIGGQTIWGAAGHYRNVPGDWVDYHSWDPTLRDAYPLKIKTEFAQHKEFFDHMRDTNLGRECPICQQERKEFLRTHPDPDKLKLDWAAMSAGADKDRLGQRISDLTMMEARQVGRHIYRQSIRVIQEPGGPLKTYIRLMATMAAAAWDHPAYGSDLAQMFTKIPNSLHENIRNLNTGLVYNGSVNFLVGDNDRNSHRMTDTPTYDDRDMLNFREELTCPFESSYDKAPFYQPMADLADVNGNQFWVSREGYPVFMPTNWPLRPWGPDSEKKSNNTLRWQWNLKYGASISSYSHSLNSEAVITQCWVTATTAFDSTFTVTAGGTGFKGTGERVMYSALAGNKEGLALTSGVQQVETVAMENQMLGLDWNTKAADFGIRQELTGSTDDDDRTMVLNARPLMYDGEPAAKKGSTGQAAVARVQRTVNFFLIRRHLAPISFNSKFYYTIYEDGKFGDLTEKAVVDLLQYIYMNTPVGQTPSDNPELAGKSGASLSAIEGNINAKVWGRGAFIWAKNFIDTIAKNYIKNDIWWYVHNGREWNEYVGAVTGISVPVKARRGITRKTRTNIKSVEEPLYTIDDLGLQREVEKWQKSFIHAAVNVGNKVVDDSINKATIRSLTCNYSDPRIQPGDVIWAEVPGHLTTTNVFGRDRPPFKNGIYITAVQRQLDLSGGASSATYSGYRYRGDIGADSAANISAANGFGFLGGTGT